MKDTMARERIRVYEEKPALSFWYWLVPLLLLLAFLGYFVRHRRMQAARAATVTVSDTSMLPDLGVLQFDTGKPTLTADGQATLDRAAEAMHGNPNVRMRMEGFAGGALRGKERRRDTLAGQRAATVGRYLDAKGIDHARVTDGRFKPLAGDDLSAFVEPNVDVRRVELYVK